VRFEGTRWRGSRVLSKVHANLKGLGKRRNDGGDRVEAFTQGELVPEMSRNSWLNWYPDRQVESSIVEFGKVLRETSASTVLDFGCGTGRNTVYLAQLGFDVYAFDWSEAALERARTELSRQGLSAHLRGWDMNETPFPYSNKFFDAILIMRVMHHTYVDNIKRIASEVSRIAKKVSYLYVEVPTLEKALKSLPKGVKSKQPEPGTFVPSSGDEAGIPHHHFRRDELIALFRDFVPLSIEERKDHYCLTARRS